MATLDIKPIQTRYAGCHFRSRLEARWAVFFDAIGTPWLYEPQGYDVAGTWYLPDFWLPDLECWVEVKGRFGPGQWATLLSAARSGLPSVPDGLPRRGALVRPGGPVIALLGQLPAPSGRDTVIWALRPMVGSHGDLVASIVSASFRADQLFIHGDYWTAEHVSNPDAFLLGDGQALYVVPDPRVLKAYAMARSARFEHGETPDGGF